MARFITYIKKLLCCVYYIYANVVVYVLQVSSVVYVTCFSSLLYDTGFFIRLRHTRFFNRSRHTRFFKSLCYSCFYLLAYMHSLYRPSRCFYECKRVIVVSEIALHRCMYLISCFLFAIRSSISFLLLIICIRFLGMRAYLLSVQALCIGPRPFERVAEQVEHHTPLHYTVVYISMMASSRKMKMEKNESHLQWIFNTPPEIIKFFYRACLETLIVSVQITQA